MSCNSLIWSAFSFSSDAILPLAASPASIRLARETSCSAVSSGTLPISLRYIRTGSLVTGCTERSSSAAALVAVFPWASSSSISSLISSVREQHEDAVDLVGCELDGLELLDYLIGRKAAALLAPGGELAHFVNIEVFEVFRHVSGFTALRSPGYCQLWS